MSRERENLKILQEASIILSSDERTLASLIVLKRYSKALTNITLYDIIIKYVPHLE